MRTATLARPRAGKILAAGLALLVVLYGAILRLDAITLKYGPVTQPGLLRSVQLSLVSLGLRPRRVTWEPVPEYLHRDGPPTHYLSDPYTYLQYAREMHGFYAAHRREPVFPFVTKIFLGLLGGQDVAVSFASAAFSVLAILATYLLGAYAFSPAVSANSRAPAPMWKEFGVGTVIGLGASLGLAIEYDMISWGVDGWRDDAFTCAVVLATYAMLRYARQPSRSNALFLGIVAGVACLIRITSLSFLAPGFAYLVLAAAWAGSEAKEPASERELAQPVRRSWDARLRGVGLAVLVAGVIAGPFAINCWRVFGDPLYAINVHADVYRAAEGQVVDASQTVKQFVGGEIRRRPIQTMDTFVLGMTSYPFLNKWSGFDVWLPSSGKWLSWAAILGLLLFLDSAPGRFLLLMLITSLIPYALTWRLAADWRFTEHAYPFLLLAAWFAIARGLAATHAVWRWGSAAWRRRFIAPDQRRQRPEWKADRRRLIFGVAVLAAVGVGVWIVIWAFPLLTVQESLRANEPVSILTGGRDAPFFVEGWSAPIVDGNVTTRIATGRRAVVRIPLPRAEDFGLTVRLDPFPRPSSDHPVGLPRVKVFINDQLVTTVDLQWNRDRVGAYDIHVPYRMARWGFNRLAFETDGGSAGGFRLWYVRVHPSV
jgi:hypothetical protein